MSAIPEAALPVVEVLRRDVPRPADLPQPMDLDLVEHDRLRWLYYELRYVCPMGLHPKSTKEEPARAKDFADGCCRTSAVNAFAKWWDEQDDPQAAVDAVWPR